MNFDSALSLSMLAIIGIGITVVLVIILIVIIVQMSKLKKKYNAFLETSTAVDIEALLIENQQAIKAINTRETETANSIKDIRLNLESTYEKMGIVKYNAFDGMGGQMSAVIALLNKGGDGCLVNSIYSNSGNHIYVKEIVKCKCELALSGEEETAIKKAMTE